jgi:phage tail-like protein
MADTGKRKDPLTTFLFGLKIPDLKMDHADGTAFFRSIGGLKFDTDVVDYQQGGVTAFTYKLIGVTKWSNLILKQGFTGSNVLWDWRYNPRRVDGTVYQLGPEMKPMCRWEFKRGYPVKWEGPDYSADKGDLAIETIEIAHEGLEMFLEKS